MQVLLMELDDVSEKISLLFLVFDGGFEFGDLKRKVEGLMTIGSRWLG